MHFYLKNRLSVLLFLACLACSCKTTGVEDAALLTVSYSDFENVIPVEGFVEPLRSTPIVCPVFIDGTIISLVDDGTIVEKGDVICVLEDANLGSNYDQTKLALENAEATLNKTRADLEMQYALLASQVASNEADAEIARMDSLQLVYATPNQRRIMELQLESSAISKAKFDKKLEALAIIQQSEIRRWEVQIRTLTDRVATVQERMDALNVKAPESGLLVRSNSLLTGQKLMVGDPLWGNMPIATIPQMDGMKVRMRTGEREFKQINVNDSVSFLFDAMPGNFASGKVISKVPVGQPVKRGSKVKVFELEASIDSVAVMPEPGFTASCRVVPQKIKDVIVVPQIAVFEQDSVRVAYVKQRRGYEMRQVATGASSLRETVITEGLEPGEVISLAKPKLSLVRKKTLLPPKRKEYDPAIDSISKYKPLWKPEPGEPPQASPPLP